MVEPVEPRPTLNQVYANSAQVVDISKALEIAYHLMGLYQLTKGEDQEDQEISELWRFRAFLFLNRACELSCVNLYINLAETTRGLEQAWFSYNLDSSFCPFLEFLGYTETMTEDQARMRALS